MIYYIIYNNKNPDTQQENRYGKFEKIRKENSQKDSLDQDGPNTVIDYRKRPKLKNILTQRQTSGKDALNFMAT